MARPSSSDDTIRAHIDQAELPEIQVLLVDLLIGETLHIDAYQLNDDGELDAENDERYRTLSNMASAEGISLEKAATDDVEEPETQPAAAAAEETPGSEVADGDLVMAEDFVEAPEAAVKPTSKKAKAKQPASAPAPASPTPLSAWPFPNSPAEKAIPSTTKAPAA